VSADPLERRVGERLARDLVAAVVPGAPDAHALSAVGGVTAEDLVIVIGETVELHLD
jgi:hypothetical protein